MNKFLVLLLIGMMQFACTAMPIKINELNVGVLNCIYWNDLVLADGMSFTNYLSKKNSLNAEVYLYDNDGQKPAIFVKLEIPTKYDAVIELRKNGEHYEYSNYAEGRALGGMKPQGAERIGAKDLNLKVLEGTFKYLTKKEAEVFIGNCFGKCKGQTYFVGPLSETNAFINVYEKEKDLIWWLPISPAVLDEDGPHDLKIACPASHWGKPKIGSSTELKKTKEILLKTGTKVQCK